MRPEETGSPLGGTLEQHNFKDVDGLGAERPAPGLLRGCSVWGAAVGGWGSCRRKKKRSFET